MFICKYHPSLFNDDQITIINIIARYSKLLPNNAGILIIQLVVYKHSNVCAQPHDMLRVRASARRIGT